MPAAARARHPFGRKSSAIRYRGAFRGGYLGEGDWQYVTREQNSIIMRREVETGMNAHPGTRVPPVVAIITALCFASSLPAAVLASTASVSTVAAASTANPAPGGFSCCNWS
jgi:hypothetical protein